MKEFSICCQGGRGQPTYGKFHMFFADHSSSIQIVQSWGKVCNILYKESTYKKYNRIFPMTVFCKKPTKKVVLT